MAYLLKLAEIIWLSKKNAKVVGVSRDACVRTVYRSYPVARLVFPFAFDTPGSPVVITFLLETGWRMQVEYDDCYGSTVSGAKRDGVPMGTHKVVQNPSQGPAFGCLRT